MLLFDAADPQIEIPEPRWERPAMLIPGRKPVGPVQVDWSNPLAKGLIVCLASSVSATVEQSSNKTIDWYFQGDGAGYPLYPVDRALVYDLGQEGQYFSTANVDVPDVNDISELTFFMRGFPNSISGRVWPFAPSTRTVFFSSSGTITYRLQSNVGGVGQQRVTLQSVADYDADAAYVPATDYPIDHGFTYSSNDQIRMYAEGREVYEVACGSRAVSSPVIFGSSSTTGGSGTVFVECLYVFRRRLSSQEWASLSVDPYQFLIPA